MSEIEALQPYVYVLASMQVKGNDIERGTVRDEPPPTTLAGWLGLAVSRGARATVSEANDPDPVVVAKYTVAYGGCLCVCMKSLLAEREQDAIALLEAAQVARAARERRDEPELAQSLQALGAAVILWGRRRASAEGDADPLQPLQKALGWAAAAAARLDPGLTHTGQPN